MGFAPAAGPPHFPNTPARQSRASRFFDPLATLALTPRPKRNRQAAKVAVTERSRRACPSTTLDTRVASALLFRGFRIAAMEEIVRGYRCVVVDLLVIAFCTVLAGHVTFTVIDRSFDRMLSDQLLWPAPLAPNRRRPHPIGPMAQANQNQVAGLRLSHLSPDGPLAKVRFRDGDVICSVNGWEMSSPDRSNTTLRDGATTPLRRAARGRGSRRRWRRPSS
jgi:hypothetical protein